MHTLFVGSCPKEHDRPEANEDAYALSRDGQRAVICDGASESYNSRLWARLLAEKLAITPDFGAEWLRSTVSDYLAQHDLDNMSWSGQLAFERGCFATLLAAEHDTAANQLLLFGVGDTVAVLFNGADVVRSWPLNEPSKFRERPTLLSTLDKYNEFIRDVGFDDRHRLAISLSHFTDLTLLCMTDALGEWTLRTWQDAPERLTGLLEIRTEERLTEFVLAERAAKRMRVDDSTLIILRFDSVEVGIGLSEP